MVKGAIEFLLSNCKEAKMLRSKCVFKIVPMLNPDGVVYGNYRCSLLGVDLNRRWKHPNKIMHPTIFYTKKLIEIFSEEREVALFCDFHGHSIKKDIFAYACSYKRCDIYKVKENLVIRLIPYILSKVNPLFSYNNSHFRVEQSKISTGRIVNFKEYKILNSYTIEASFFGQSEHNHHFTTTDLESIGHDLCLICSVFTSKHEFRSQISQLTEFLKDLKKKESLQKTPKKAENENFGDEENLGFCIKEEIKHMEEVNLKDLYIPEEDDDSGGSDSQASLNDDKKIKFLVKKNKKKFKNSAKVSPSPIRSNKIMNNSTYIKKKNSLTPEQFPRPRPKSRNSFKHRIEVIKQIIPTKIMLKSPFLEENVEIKSKSSISNKSCIKTNIKEATHIKPLRKLDDILRELGLTDSFSQKTHFKRQKSFK